MSLFTFKGGIHPDDGKALSKDKAIVEIKPKGDLVFPVSQHIGAPSNPVVAVGDEVKRGQLIAEAGGFVSANIYSSVSGKVTKIEPRFAPAGSKVNCIVIENDGEYSEVEFPQGIPMEDATKADILDRIKEAGIVGMGGAGFPTHVKLNPKEPEKIEYVIVDCAECEPYITADYRRMLEYTKEVVGGLKLVLKLFENATGILAVEDNKMDCVEKLTEFTKNEDKIKVMALEAKYPQGSERQLIYATTKRAINSSMLPSEAGCSVNNVETMVAIYNAVINGRPLLERVVTISGTAIQNPSNFKVLIGTNHNELIEAAGGYAVEPEKLISGGPMMGFAMFTTDVPVTKTTSSFLAMSQDDVAKYEASACINCGRCVEVCPSRIIPSRLAIFAEHQQPEQFEKWNGLECVECGSCSYVCPAKRHLKQYISTQKKLIIASRRK